MSEGMTFAEHVKAERWCTEKVPEGQECWPHGSGWHPMRGHCKRRGITKVDGQWRCKKHMPEATGR